MALRNFRTALLHVSYIAGAIWLSAHELALHNITDSDVYKGPTESPMSYPLNPPFVTSVEPVQQPSPISTIFDAPTFTTTEYITVTRDEVQTPVPYIHRGLSSRNPYANNTFVLGVIPYIVPFFKSSCGQALSHILSSFSSHPITNAFYQAIASLVSLLLYLWTILPGGKQGLNTLALALSLYALQFAYFWDPLSRWFFRLFRRHDDKLHPFDDSASSPASSSRSGKRPGRDDDNFSSGSLKPPKDTSSTETQTAPGNTRSAETQTTDLVTESEQNCLNEVARLQDELAQAKARISIQDSTISARDRSNAECQELILTLKRESDKDGSTIRHRNAQIRNLQDERNFIAQTHQREVNRLQAQIDATVSSRQAEIDEIKRLKDAHEAQIKELKVDHDNALAQQAESISGTAGDADIAEERQRSERQIGDLQEEVAALKEALSKEKADEATAEEQKKLSVEAQSAQEQALRDCNNRVRALESTNTRLVQQNEALLERESAAKQAEERARTEAKALQGQVDSLNHSLSLPRAGEEAAARLQQEIADETQRLRDTEATLNARVSELQQELSQTKAANDTAVRQQQEDAAAAQQSEERLKSLISSLERDLLQARHTYESSREAAVRQHQQENDAVAAQTQETLDKLTGALQEANSDNKSLRHQLAGTQQELSETQKKNEEIRELGRNLETAHNQSSDLNQRYKQEGDVLQTAHDSLKKAYDEQAQTHVAEKTALQEQAHKILQHEKQNSESLRNNVRDLQNKLSQAEEEKSEAQGQISCLQNELEMQRRVHENLIATNNDLANQDFMNQWATLSAADADQDSSVAQTPPQDQGIGGTDATPSPTRDEQMGDANPTIQQNPFFNAPTFPPPRGPAGSSPFASPARSPGGRKILKPTGVRSKSPPKKSSTGESMDPAQDILNWCTDRQDDDAATVSPSPTFSDHVTRSPRGVSFSPLRQLFDLSSSHPATPNVFDTVNGALGNAPVLPPNPSFQAIAPGQSQNPSAPGTPLDPSLGGAMPPITPGVANTPLNRRDQERAEYRAKQHEVRQQRLHEERKTEAERIYQEMLREELGNFEDENEADHKMDTTQTPATGGNRYADMSGASPSNMVEGSDAELNYLHHVMPSNVDGRHDALYRGNNYKMPDDWDEFDNPIWL
ncbi:hypothetical protein QM012_004541 [Aureobasidium pullulans]|uniref:Uncharacterized protein n=1 Tax=Aureobasidium pullulans TaxID=5580 RepID=A0ABR0TTJ1_AURPU